MSDCDNEKSEVGVSAIAEENEVKQEEENNNGGFGVDSGKEEKGRQREFGCGSGRVFFGAKRKLRGKNSKCKRSSSPTTSDSRISRISSSLLNKGCICLMKPKTLDDSDGGSPTSDPNSPSFSYEMLKSVLVMVNGFE
ncbi:hypothetical protein RJ641_023823 [Dillenia turbinata]|uniref:Uncharacterized protein n=1 Tax=Dillenia turbinata TaxID=194707 RepID=A0AAN8YT69_9MAGN